MSKSKYIATPRKYQPCIVCGQWHDSKQKRDYCSTACNYKDRKQKGLIKPQLNRKPGKGCKERAYTCIGCGVGFTVRRTPSFGGKYCSKACAYDHRSATPYSNIHTGNCAECGIAFISKRKRALCGSDECRKSEASKRSAEIDRAQHKADTTKHERKCTQCGVMFCRLYGYADSLCSDECRDIIWRRKKRANRFGSTASSRARRYGVKYEPINPINVFESYGWMCAMCGISTPKSLRGKHKHDSPELDHIMPISKGGPHTLENVQCLCRRCNGAKGDRILPAKLSLYDNAI